MDEEANGFYSLIEREGPVARPLVDPGRLRIAGAVKTTRMSHEQDRTNARRYAHRRRAQRALRAAGPLCALDEAVDRLGAARADTTMAARANEPTQLEQDEIALAMGRAEHGVEDAPIARGPDPARDR